MKRRAVLLGLAALALAAFAWYWMRPGQPPRPLSTSAERGPVVPVADYRLSGPYTHQNLTLFLVHGPETLDARSFLTLQEALEQNKVVVHETGDVHELAVENLADDAEVYIQSGDIVKGGRQDRTLPYDTVVGPKSGRVPIDSFCVEQGRWAQRGGESSDYFSSARYSLATSDLKRAGSHKGEASQAEVWRSVARTQERLSQKLGDSVRAEASESSLQLTLESPAVRASVAPYLRRLGTALDGHDDVIGYVAAVNGRVLSADVYASRALFRKLWPRLVEGSAVEAFIEADPGRRVDPVGEDAVRRFLARAERGEVHDQAQTDRTCVLVRRTDQTMLFESCDRSRGNLVLHRSFLAL